MISPDAIFDNAPATAGLVTFDDSPLPEGPQNLRITSCEVRSYLDGVKRKPEDIANACSSDPNLLPGSEVAIAYEVMDGKFAKRKLFGNYCIKASSNQQTYGEFTPERKVDIGVGELNGLARRIGRIEKGKPWSDWVDKIFTAYVTARASAPKLAPDGVTILKAARVFNGVRLLVGENEVLPPPPVITKSDTAPTKATDEAPF